MSIGVWTDQGAVITNGAGNNPLVPNVLFESGAHILSGTVFKMWYTAFAGNLGVCYAESTDGLTWSQYSGNPVIAGQGFAKIFKNGSTYYLFSGDLGGFPQAIKVYTSSDGLTWALQNANAILVGTPGSWDSGTVVQLGVLGVIGGIWYGYYSGIMAGATAAQQNWPTGLATSTDGINWTKSPNNPIIARPSGNFTFAQVGLTYYGWSQITLTDIPTPNLAFPSDIMRFSATDPSGPWTALGTPTIYRTTAAEGINTTAGQVADPSLVSANGNLYMYFSADSDGINGVGRVINVATAPSMTVAQLVSSFEGIVNIPIPDGLGLQLNTLASDTFQRANANPIAGNWSPLLVGQTAQLLSHTVTSSVAGTPGDSYWNAIVWGADQWSKITVGPMVTGSFVGASVRENTSGVQTAYRFVWGGTTGTSGTYFFQKVVAGAFTTIDSNALTVNVGDTLTICAVGTQISTYWNQVLISTVTDSGIATGAAGFEVDAVGSVNSAAITAWSGGNFQAAPSLFSISGTALIAGATVSYTGTSSGSVTADGSGNYTIAGLLNGTYTITPSAPGISFTPASQIVTVSNASVSGINFTTSGKSLSGNVGVEGQPLSGVTITWSGTSSGSAVTDSFGNWTTGLTLANGSYFLVPAISGYTFQPASSTQVIASQNIVGINFEAVPSQTEGVISRELHIEYTGSPALVQSDINTPDNKNGSSTVQIVNENVTLVVTPPVGIPQPGRFGTVHGRLDTFSIINNPDRLLKPFNN